MVKSLLHTTHFSFPHSLLNHVMWDYRSEKWWSLLSAASVLALQCAYNTVAMTEYIGLALEFIGIRVTTSAEEKTRVYGNLMKIFSVSMASFVLYFWNNLHNPPSNVRMPTTCVFLGCDDIVWNRLIFLSTSPNTVNQNPVKNGHLPKETFSNQKCENEGRFPHWNPLMLAELGSHEW